MHSGYGQILLQGGQADEGFRAERDRLTRTGDYAGLLDLAQGKRGFKDVVQYASVARLEGDALATASNAYANGVGGGAVMMRGLAGIGERENEKRLMSSVDMSGYLKFTEAQKDLGAMYVAHDLTSKDLEARGFTPEMRHTMLAINGMASVPGSAMEAFMAERYAGAAYRRYGNTMDRIKGHRVAIEAHQIKAQNEQHAGQGLLPGAFNGEIHSFADALSSMGVLATSDEINFYKNELDPDDMTFLTGQAKSRQAALKILKDPKASQDEKEKATEQLRDAVKAFNGAGLEEHDKDARAFIGLPAEEAVKGNDIQGKDGSGAQKADPAKDPTGKAPNGTKGKPGTEQNVNVKTDARLEIDIKMNGQPLAVGDATTKITKNQGYNAISFLGNK